MIRYSPLDALILIKGKKYEVRVRNRDDTTFTVIARYNGKDLRGIKHQWTYGVGTKTTNVADVYKRIYWFTGRLPTLYETFSLIFAAAALVVSLWKN